MHVQVVHVQRSWDDHAPLLLVAYFLMKSLGVPIEGQGSSASSASPSRGACTTATRPRPRRHGMAAHRCPRQFPARPGEGDVMIMIVCVSDQCVEVWPGVCSTMDFVRAGTDSGAFQVMQAAAVPVACTWPLGAK